MLISLLGICLVSSFPNIFLPHLAASTTQHAFCSSVWWVVLGCCTCLHGLMPWCVIYLLSLCVKIPNTAYTHSRVDAQMIGSVSMCFSRWWKRVPYFTYLKCQTQWNLLLPDLNWSDRVILVSISPAWGEVAQSIATAFRSCDRAMCTSGFAAGWPVFIWFRGES